MSPLAFGSMSGENEYTYLPLLYSNSSNVIIFSPLSIEIIHHDPSDTQAILFDNYILFELFHDYLHI